MFSTMRATPSFSLSFQATEKKEESSTVRGNAEIGGNELVEIVDTPVTNCIAVLFRSNYDGKEEGTSQFEHRCMKTLPI